MNTAVILLVATFPGVQLHVAVHGDKEIDTAPQPVITVPLSLKATDPAIEAVAVKVTVVPYVAVVAFPGNATEIDDAASDVAEMLPDPAT